MDNDISNLLVQFSMDVGDSMVITDLGQVSQDNYALMGSATKAILQGLSYDIGDFESVIVASSSFPSGLGNLDVREEPHTMSRYEWSLFNIVASDDLQLIKYGDYGIKTSIFADVPYMGSISLKYSNSTEFIIFRGARTVDHPLGNNQFIEHTKKLVETHYYENQEFSWGDLRYHQISLQNASTGRPGSTTNWVEFSQNHHITLMHSIL